MTGGSIIGNVWPCSLSLINFIAMENSSWSIFPSLFRSERVHISARTAGGSPDCKKKVLACSPVMIPLDGFRLANCWSCLARSSVVIAHMFGPPFRAVGK